MEYFESSPRGPTSLILRNLTELGSERIFHSQVRRGHRMQFFSPTILMLRKFPVNGLTYLSYALGLPFCPSGSTVRLQFHLGESIMSRELTPISFPYFFFDSI